MKESVLCNFSQRYGDKEAEYLSAIFDQEISRAIRKKNREACNLRKRVKETEKRVFQYEIVLHNFASSISQSFNGDLVLFLQNHYQQYKTMLIDLEQQK